MAGASVALSLASLNKVDELCRPLSQCQKVFALVGTASSDLPISASLAGVMVLT
jgi:hypothetical protein